MHLHLLDEDMSPCWEKLRGLCELRNPRGLEVGTGGAGLPPPRKVAQRVAPGALDADLPSEWSSPRVLPALHCQETGSGRALDLSEQAGSPWSPSHSRGRQ